jgi:hypothetical protein
MPVCEIPHGTASITPRRTLPLIVQQSKGSKSTLFDTQGYLNENRLKVTI